MAYLQQMGPTKLVLVEQILVSSIIVRYPDSPVVGSELVAKLLLALAVNKEGSEVKT